MGMKNRPRHRRAHRIAWIGLLAGLLPGLLALALTLLLGGWSSRSHAATYTVAIVPQFPAVEIHRAWSPVLERLGRETGDRFVLLPSPSIPAFEAQFQAAGPDFVFLNPYHMVMARAAQGYEPLLRDGSRALTGVLVVRADDAATGIEALDGRDVAFPSPNAFGASLYMRALLAERGVRIRPDYVKTHSNAYRHVVAGAAAAAGGVRATLEAEDPAVRAGLRVLFETPPTPPHPLAAHPRVPVAVRQAVVRTLQGWRDTAPELLRAIQLGEPVVADYARDYGPLERLGLARFVVVAP